jgi:2-hydroxy-3-keto-5-methylthiopentenyl-1-phosphate phosphatase
VGRVKNMKSIMHEKDGTCYLCKKLHGITETYTYTEEHHVFEGTANRKISERAGLKVYLCAPHHRTSKEAVHVNNEIAQNLKQEAQKRFEEYYNEMNTDAFRLLFGKNWRAVPEPKEDSKKNIENWSESLEGFQKLQDNDILPEDNWF